MITSIHFIPKGSVPLEPKHVLEVEKDKPPSIKDTEKSFFDVYTKNLLEKTQKNVYDEEQHDEELLLKEEDILVATTKISKDLSFIEIYVYEIEEKNLYVHHDVLLYSTPVCSVWMDNLSYQEENAFMSVGSMDGLIDMWCLDCIDVFSPKQSFDGEDRHTDPVLSLSWNRECLVSCSIDKTIKIWDIEHGKNIFGLSKQKRTPYVVEWAEKNKNVFFSCNRTSGYLFDKRDGKNGEKLTKMSSLVETAKWSPFSEFHILTGEENGKIKYIDIRNTKNSVFENHKNKKTTTTISWSKQTPNVFVSGSKDNKRRKWFVNADKLDCLDKKRTGDILCSASSTDLNDLFVFGGNDGLPTFWPCSNNKI